MRLPLLLSVFGLSDVHVSLTVCYSFIFMLYFVYNFNNNNSNNIAENSKTLKN